MVAIMDGTDQPVAFLAIMTFIVLGMSVIDIVVSVQVTV